jgi:hypothetical protein
MNIVVAFDRWSVARRRGGKAPAGIAVRLAEAVRASPPRMRTGPG